MLQYLGIHLVGQFAESFIDNVVRDTVRPVPGSVVYCDLAFGAAEHSGIYLGHGKIAHLDGCGEIEIVGPNAFLRRLDGFNSAMSIYVSCNGGRAVGSPQVADRAKKMAGRRRDYSFLLDNCHQFSAGCLVSNFENYNNFLWMLKDRAKETIGSNTWRVWETKDLVYQI